MAEIVKLKKEYKISGKNLKEVVLDFDTMTGVDMLEAEKEYSKRNKASTVKELEDGWYLTVAEKASGIKYGDFLKFGVQDYVAIITKVKVFLNGLDSETETEMQENSSGTEESK